ncbi:MBL fold metallo-hydrolase [Streptomyces canus]|uniref:Hydroxyacylglutathione hydrolase n=1 Tax=Streptomyces canus TaxID=58343 RepID=A0AAW8F8Y5_9ACTN|nr:MBL fold metallo-hydrolase [Streptomyces canus]MDQ0764958.1 hydroxyacylglutathione hydrolase [Streptomyces canus]MDQ0906586.1 hydroxyacylglutathione hydrolase [Streptomyces canus]MDQ1066605.1 hydroxyacylglutathione hydrolase [Streptomyces canus]
MLITSFSAAAFDTNCHVVSAGAGEECVIIDPGVGVVEVLEQVIDYYKLRPTHVLLTHAHSDHVHSVTPVCGTYGIATTVHDADRYRLHDPLADLEPHLLRMLEENFGSRNSWREPDEIMTINQDMTLELAGLEFKVTHSPGHTEGSVIFQINDIPEELSEDGSLIQTVFTGDVVVAGGIGRSDLPGGDSVAMRQTISENILPIPDHTLLLPGHGPATNMKVERGSNPALLTIARGGIAEST